MHFGRKNCETIRQLSCFTYTCRKKHKLLSRCVLYVSRNHRRINSLFFRQNLRSPSHSALKTDRHQLSWVYHRASILLDDSGNRNCHKLDYTRKENKIVDRREGVIYFRKKWAGTCLFRRIGSLWYQTN